MGEEYSLADVQAGDLPPERDLLGSLVLPEVVESPGEVVLAVPYQATERREIRVFLHDSEDNWFTVAQGNATVEPGSGMEVVRLPVLPQAREGAGYVWAVRLLPLGWTGVVGLGAGFQRQLADGGPRSGACWSRCRSPHLQPKDRSGGPCRRWLCLGRAVVAHWLGNGGRCLGGGIQFG